MVEVAAERGLPLPDWYLEEPGEFSGDAFFIEAFNDLSTCRDTGHSMGPIPWDKIVEYGRFKALDDDLLPVFVRIIRQMDSAYSDWHSDKVRQDKAIAEAERKRDGRLQHPRRSRS